MLVVEVWSDGAAYPKDLVAFAVEEAIGWTSALRQQLQLPNGFEAGEREESGSGTETTAFNRAVSTRRGGEDCGHRFEQQPYVGWGSVSWKAAVAAAEAASRPPPALPALKNTDVPITTTAGGDGSVASPSTAVILTRKQWQGDKGEGVDLRRKENELAEEGRLKGPKILKGSRSVTKEEVEEESQLRGQFFGKRKGSRG